MKTRIAILCLGVLTPSIKANAQLGYLRKDARYIQGSVADQGIYKNNRQLIFTEKGEPVTYTPDHIEEYGFFKGEVYIKRSVKEGQRSSNYLLLRLINGERTLYKLKEKKGSRFFIEHDSSLVEIKKEEPLKDQLRHQLKVCGSSQQIAALAKYGEPSLKRAVWLSNSCYTGPFPRRRIGGLIGYEFGSQSFESIVDHISIQASTSYPIVGIFGEVPLGMSPFWFMNLQLTYQQSNFSESHAENNSTVEYQNNFSAIGFPLLLKYRGSSPIWRPFLALGPTPAFSRQQQNVWLTSTNAGSVVYLNQGSWDNVKKFQINGTICAGIEYSIAPTKTVSLELRYKKLIDAQVGPSQSITFISSYYF